MKQGTMVTTCSLQCALCTGIDLLPGDADKAKEEAVEHGWALTKELGWVCFNCQQNSEPLRKLLPESTIVKDQPFEE